MKKNYKCKILAVLIVIGSVFVSSAAFSQVKGKIISAEWYSPFNNFYNPSVVAAAIKKYKVYNNCPSSVRELIKGNVYEYGSNYPGEQSIVKDTYISYSSIGLAKENGRYRLTLTPDSRVNVLGEGKLLNGYTFGVTKMKARYLLPDQDKAGVDNPRAYFNFTAKNQKPVQASIEDKICSINYRISSMGEVASFDRATDVFKVERDIVCKNYKTKKKVVQCKASTILVTI